MLRPKTLRERIESRIARKRREDVFLTREFRDLGVEDQVLRALRTLEREKRLVRLGYGVYWPRSCLASFRRPNPLQPERISRRGTAGSY